MSKWTEKKLKYEILVFRTFASKVGRWISIVHEDGFKTNVNVRYIENDSKLESHLVHFKKLSEYYHIG